MTSLEQIARKIAGELNDAFDQAMADAEDLLRMNGASEFEREAYLESYRAQLATWRTQTFAEIFAQFQRNGQTLQ